MSTCTESIHCRTNKTITPHYKKHDTTNYHQPPVQNKIKTSNTRDNHSRLTVSISTGNIKTAKTNIEITINGRRWCTRGRNDLLRRICSSLRRRRRRHRSTYHLHHQNIYLHRLRHCHHPVDIL